MTKVSIITSTYNGAKFIDETINSVLGQTYTNFEYFIINDASTDNTEEILKGYERKDSRIKIITNKRNLERSASRNKGIRVAKGEYIAFLDDDDVWEKEKLEKQVAFLDGNKDYVFCGTNVNFINKTGNQIGQSNNLENNDDIKTKFLSYNPFIFSSILIRKNGLKLFNEKINMAEDYDFLLNNGTRGKVKNLKDALAQYRLANNSSLKNQLKLRLNCIKNCLKYRKEYPNFKKALFLWIILFFIPYKIVKILNQLTPDNVKKFLF